MARFLFLEPEQHILIYGSCVAREIAEEIRNLGHEVIEIEKAHTQDAIDAINQYNPDIVWWVGHGNTCVTTLECQEIFIVKKEGHPVCYEDVNPDILRNRFACALSCLTGTILGPKLVSENNVIAYLGYNDYFWLLTCSPPCPCGEPKDPNIRDEIWYPGLKCMHESNLFWVLGLAQGLTAGEANEFSLERFQHWINYFENIEPQNDDETNFISNVLWMLIVDKNAQVLCGDENANLFAKKKSIYPFLGITMGLGIFGLYFMKK